jgi:hypothetical protein
MISETPGPFRLRSQRVDLAIHFLEEEVELAAARLGRVRQRAPVLEMAPEPHRLLGHVRTVRVADDLLRDGPLVHGEIGAQFLDALAQPRAQRVGPGVRRRRGAVEQIAELGAPSRPAPSAGGALRRSASDRDRRARPPAPLRPPGGIAGSGDSSLRSGDADGLREAQQIAGGQGRR